MSDRPGRQIENRPEIIVMPALSAPIDEGPFYPKPRLGTLGIAWRVGIVMGIAALVAFAVLTHGAVFR